MTLESALNYAEKLLKILDAYKITCGGAKIHDVKQEIGMLQGWVYLVQKKPDSLSDLLEGIQRAEAFIRNSV